MVEETGIESHSASTSKLQQFFDRNGRYIQYAAAGVGVLGLVLISRSVRIGTRFTNVEKIPPEFYDKNVNLYGQIKDIDRENSSVLLVEHLPILKLRSKTGQPTSSTNNGLLRVQIPGLEFCQSFGDMVHANPNVVHGKIKFTLLHVNNMNKTALCLVYYRRYFLMRNFGVWCVKNNIATISSSKLLQELPSPLWNIKKLSIYYKPLLKLESHNKSEKLRHKIWNRLKYFLSKIFRSSSK